MSGRWVVLDESRVDPRTDHRRVRVALVLTGQLRRVAGAVIGGAGGGKSYTRASRSSVVLIAALPRACRVRSGPAARGARSA